MDIEGLRFHIPAYLDRMLERVKNGADLTEIDDMLPILDVVLPVFVNKFAEFTPAQLDVVARIAALFAGGLASSCSYKLRDAASAIRDIVDKLR